MEYNLPTIGKKPVPFPHFPTRQQAFLFRAAEFVSYRKIAEVVKTDEQTVRQAAAQVGLPDSEPGSMSSCFSCWR